MKTQLATVVLALMLLPMFPANALVTITRHPTNQWVSLGAHVTNSVTASSSAPPITYQWYGKGALLPDQTSRTLVLNSIQLDQVGEYYVVVNDAENQPLHSNPATVTVDPTFIKLMEGAIVTDREPSFSSTWLDYDGDDHLDLYVLNLDGGSPAKTSLYRGLGDGTFERITNSLSARVARNVTAAVADYDHDGDEDIYVLGNTWPTHDYRPDDLYQNRGHGEFVTVPGQPWRLDLDNSNDCGWADYDGDGLLDIYVANAHLEDPECLYRQQPDGSFIKMTAAQVGSIITVNLATDACAWADYDNDGDPDLWVSSRDGHAPLHQNDGRGYFSAATNSGSITTVPANGTGVWGDYDNDGWLDFFTVAYVWAPVTTAVNALHRNLEGTSFTDVASAAGVALANNAWASAWGDYDNDGWLDLFVANFENGTNLFYRNLGNGTFEKLDVGSPIRDGNLRATVAWVDYDNDGLLDLFITCGNGTDLPNHLFRNNLAAAGNTNHWLKVKLNGQAANRSGIGAKVRVKALINGQEVWQVREISGNSGYQGGYGLMAHFGLGDATKADIVRVEWPSGNVQELSDVTAGQTGQGPLTITEQVMITPVRPSASLGGSVTLTAQLNGTWQWYHNGDALQGQTAKTLTLSNIQASDAGRYSVVVDTGSGTVTNHVHLLVDTQFERIELADTVQSWGAAWGDYDNDGYPDLIVCNGQWVSTGTAALYRNNQDGTLVRKTPAEVGPLVELVRNWEHAHWGDYDNDGYLDLIASENNDNPRPSLWRNLGNGRFEETTTQAGSFLEDRLWCVPIWGDLNRDGLLDLAVANTSDYPPQWPDWCRNLLYFNQGDGTFLKDTQNEFVQLWRDFNTEGGSAADFDGDGDLDIMITSNADRPAPTTVLLFENDGTGQFRQAAFPTVAGASSTAVWADYDNDGRLDVFVPVWDRPSQLFRNEGNDQWTVTPLGAPSQTLSAAWADYDNDGDLDLFIARGFNTTTTCLFYANNGDGTFTQVTLGSLPNHPGRSVGCAWADYDNNGFQDLIVPGAKDFPEALYRNHGNGNHWISFKLVGTRSNRSAIGAKVRVLATIFGKTTWQMREVGGASRQQNDLRPHFGLGDAPRATTVRIEWPSGTIETFSNVPADQIMTIVEPSLRGAIKPDGELELSVTATLNRTCTIEHSSDLATWTVLTTVTGAGETPVNCIDTAAPGQSHRFYRLK